MSPAACSFNAPSVTPSRRTPNAEGRRPKAEHVSDQILRHHRYVALQAIHAQQQPGAKVLVQRVVPIADRGLRQLRDEGLHVTQH
jgi:hypothetical protein